MPRPLIITIDATIILARMRDGAKALRARAALGVTREEHKGETVFIHTPEARLDLARAADIDRFADEIEAIIKEELGHDHGQDCAPCRARQGQPATA